MARITKVEQKIPTIKTKKKVAAYARISMESERMPCRKKRQSLKKRLRWLLK